MKSLKTLIISAAVCGAMALPLSGLAAGHGGHGQSKHDRGGDDRSVALIMKKINDSKDPDILAKVVKKTCLEAKQTKRSRDDCSKAKAVLAKMHGDKGPGKGKRDKGSDRGGRGGM